MPEVRVEKLCTDPELYIIRVDDDRIRYFEATW